MFEFGFYFEDLVQLGFFPTRYFLLHLLQVLVLNCHRENLQVQSLALYGLQWGLGNGEGVGVRDCQIPSLPHGQASIFAAGEEQALDLGNWACEQVPVPPPRNLDAGIGGETLHWTDLHCAIGSTGNEPFAPNFHEGYLQVMGLQLVDWGWNLHLYFRIELCDWLLWLLVQFYHLVSPCWNYLAAWQHLDEFLVQIGPQSIYVTGKFKLFSSQLCTHCRWAIDHQNSETYATKQMLEFGFD